jgi:vitamin B12 transporter
MSQLSGLGVYLVLLIGVLGSGTPLFAQTPDSVRLKDIVVTATRSPTPARSVGSSADVLWPAELARHQIFALRDALQLVPGATLLVSGAPGAVTSLFLRGVASTQTLFRVDGIRSNDANASFAETLGGTELAGTDRIEIVRGPQSTLYGGAAMGGVVALETLRGSGKTSGSAELGGGSFKSWRGKLDVQGGVKRLGYSLSASASGSDNQRRPNDWNQRTQTVRLDYDLARWLQVGATFRGLQNDYTSPGDLRTTNTTAADRSTYHDNLGTFFFAATPVAKWQSRLVAGMQEQHLTNASRFNGGDEFVFRLKDRRRVLDWQNTVDLGAKARIVAGVNGEWSSITTGVEQKERLWGAYAEALLTPAAPLTLTAGVRADDYNTFEDAITFRFTSAWTVPHSGTTLRGSYGTGFMPPSLSARFGSAFQNPNPGIRPERSRGWDAGVEQTLLRGRGKLTASYFHTSLRDLIGFESAPFPELGRNVNIDRARTSGVELGGAITAGSIDARASYTLLSAKSLLESDPSLARLIRRPRHTLAGDVLVSVTSRVIVGAGLVALADRQDTDFNSFPSQRINPGDYAVARLYGSWEIGALTLRLRAENLFDTQYEPVYGFPALGRSLSGSVAVRF